MEIFRKNTRREFLYNSCKLICGMGLASCFEPLTSCFLAYNPGECSPKDTPLFEAKFYKNLKEYELLECQLCPNFCKIGDGERGICGVKKNINNKLYSLVYNKVCSLHIDPVEKKPLFHFKPGTDALSIATAGCNLKCKFCQNWSISQIESPTEFITPENLVALALKYNSVGVSYTYTEPLMWYEYVLDTAKLAKEKKLVNVLVTNGYINQKPLLELLPMIDSLNIDLKSMNQDFYKKVCKGKLEVVLKSIELSLAKKRHVELTYLIIPGLNDAGEELNKFVSWVADLSDLVPVHFSRYFPAYKADFPPTPVETMKKAFQIAKRKLKYVYTGNIHIPGTSDTFCPKCNNLLISRSGYSTNLSGIEDKKCGSCKTPVDVIISN